MAKSRSRVYHRAEGQVRRDALLHPRSGWLHYRSRAKQPGRHLRLRGATTKVGENLMKSEREGINSAVKPRGTGCVECSGAGGWWFHLRRCAQCGHIGCCDSSPSQHASKHFAATGHPIITSFEPGEHWFYDYRTEESFAGPKLA